MTTFRFRRVPGYFNGSTYRVDVTAEGEVPRFLGSVKKVGGRPFETAVWRAWSKDDEKVWTHGSTRTAAADALLRKVADAEVEAGRRG